MNPSEIVEQPLAIKGGPKAVPEDAPDLFAWPIVTQEGYDAVAQVLRDGAMSKWDITKEFEQEFRAFQQVEYALGFCNGTMALESAMYAAGVGRGDEIIVPSITYWASALGAYHLRATPVFADIDPHTLCIDPGDIERHISERTRAIMVVHYCGYPCDMDPIMEIAEKHGLMVIEDVSHAQGGLYKGRPVGSIGHVNAMSMMAGKSLAIGEGGMLTTNDRRLYERAISYAHYERSVTDLTLPEVREQTVREDMAFGLPLGGVKGRMHQVSSALGRVQLKLYPDQIREIQNAMNRFWDALEGTPGLRAHRPPADSGSTMGGWYNPVGLYVPEELGGLSVGLFIQAVNAEGGRSARGCNLPLHMHPLFNTVDVYRDGKPTRIAFAERDVRQPEGSLPNAEALRAAAYGIPWFKHDRPEEIERYAAAFRKVALRAEELLVDDAQQG